MSVLTTCCEKERDGIEVTCIKKISNRMINSMLSKTTLFNETLLLQPATFLFSVVGLLLVLYLPWRYRQRPEPEIIFQKAHRFEPEAISDKIDTIVIGTGPGACTCANLLAQMGHKVLMLEQHFKTGGGTHSFKKEECEWDTGLHYTSKAMSEKTSRPGAIMDFMTKGAQKFQQIPEPCDEIVFADHSSYPFMNGKAKTLEAIMDKLDRNNLTLNQHVKTYMDIYTDIHQGFVALGLSRILPRWLHFLVRSKLDKLKKYAALTVRDVQYAVFNLGYSKDLLLRSCPHAPPHEKDHMPTRQRLKDIMSHPIGDYGTQPRDASMAAHGVTAEHYIDGGSYTVGPTQNISIRLTSVVRAYGGDVLIDATVRNILVENGRAVGVRVSKSSDLMLLGDNAPVTEIRAKRVVCGTTVYNLYHKLLPQNLPVVHKFHNTHTMRPSNGHLFVFGKLQGDPDDLPDHNVWYFADDLDSAYDAYYADPMSHRPPVVYMGFPCTKDCTWKQRFPGTSNFILICDGLYEWFKEWARQPVGHRGAEYEMFKEAMTSQLLDMLYEHVPVCKGRVVFTHTATPLTEESYLGSYHGGAYDTYCSPALFANSDWITTPHTAIPGLSVAGSSAFFPGLTGSLYGGCICACDVLGVWGTSRLAWRLVSHLAYCLREENPKLSTIQSYRLAFRKLAQE